MILKLTKLVPTPGWTVLAAALTLTALGLLGVYAAEAGNGAFPAQTMRQLSFLFVGLVGFFGIQIIGYRELGRWSYFLFGLTLLLLTLLIVARKVPMAPIIPARRNAYRWIVFGPVNIQVSEIAKLSYILALAYYLRFRTNYRSFTGLLGPFILTLIPVALILKEPDLGTSLLLPPVLFVMLFVAGAKIKHLSLILLLAAIAAPAFYFSPVMNNYQRERILAMLRQNDSDANWRLNSGYQLHQSKVALGSGGIFGQGFAEGAFFRHDLLPEEHNDFIFAVIGHQWGFAGAVGVLLCYLVMIGTGLTIASMTNDPLGRLLAVGVSALICSQTLVNIGMTVGLMPITGMTLPFASMGGSGLISNYVALGMLVSVAQRMPMDIARKPFEFDYEEAE